MKYAHSQRDPLTGQLLPKEKWHTLPKHLHDTAENATKHAEYFQNGSIGEILGYIHDYGKNSPEFQQRLEGSNKRVDHKTAGALLVNQHYPYPYGLAMAYAIYGHHGGLPNHISRGPLIGLEEVLRKNKFSIIDKEQPVLPRLVVSTAIQQLEKGSNPGITSSLWIRMLYSSLIDADYLDAERYFQPDKAALRNQFPSIEQLQTLFQPTIQELLSKPLHNHVFEARRNVLLSCLRAAEGPRGFYTLTAPTGSGKTFASLAFALEHAVQHHMRRVIVALPFTSIIEQTADVYRGVLGQNSILEHHSNVVFHQDKETEFDPRQLASENWEASLIVTTNVQLFESLFSAKPSKARKLHQLAGSVIILDEAQALPSGLLLPSLAALQCLCADYGVTVLFCTATQPALKPEWFDRIQPPTEIIDDPKSLYRNLKRVDVSNIGKKSAGDLAALLASHQRALCIVNSRKQAQRLYKLLPEKEGIIHLSALMCAEHRSKMIKMIKDMPKDARCIVIATTLVEAGVDFDFPIVYREMAGIESICQAAGRCNREGNLEIGYMYLFEFSDTSARTSWFSDKADLAKLVLRKFPDPLEPDAIHYYFKQFFGFERKKLDQYNILGNLNAGADQYSFQFAEVSRLFKFIKEDTVSVVIPYDRDAVHLLEEAQRSLYPGSFSRKLQRYTVSLYPQELEQLKHTGRLGNIENSLFYLTSLKGGISGEISDLYSEQLGLIIQAEEE
ncbi:CRISPR-associated helicase Cas3' [Paenibacillus thalictri]|uniref:CRISPR-associated helicase Cas3 n=1 Tax=Paenibacillus thalictri TaxID=2527873 RepID=A0A4Q9DT51_9BACL|nr:CRISPR-associated helicase Cas3' [Paenibacillus thalictri]TBL80093.1 CRISPR-associated helicase Cas3' [Paenibacillus thalictri]